MTEAMKKQMDELDRRELSAYIQKTGRDAVEFDDVLTTFQEIILEHDDDDDFEIEDYADEALSSHGY